ncbi:Riboflavin transporter [Pseudoruegeria aquimaris]|uniref:Riboflavin transporter n=1 Tax=Pseudoruegeria aquimaris TaxID=393663 RepID=A0A1Y5T1F8_9RHOB|nr:DMT family transporter [Pseudoruegeria aquimaris]SLN53811.1 Riboflavin transporter [Pseudoruegeria aquimaris]
MSAQATRPGHPQAHLGMGMMLMAWFLFSFVDTSVKWLVLLGIPAMQLAFMRYFVALLLTLLAGRGAARRAKRRPGAAAARAPASGLRKLTGRQVAMLSLRAFLLVSATALNFIALQYLSLTVTSAIMFSAPIFVCALSGPLLGERVGPWRWGAILLGFAGVLIIVRPWSAAFHWSAVLIVYNALALALFSILTRRLSGQVPALTMQLFMSVLGSIVLLPFALAGWESPATFRDWGLLVGLGAFAWAGHEMFSRAHAYAEASVLMPFQYSFILFMTAGSFLVFGDVPDAVTLLGAAVIVAAGLVIWWREHHA